MSPVMVQEHGHPEEWGEDASGSPASEEHRQEPVDLQRVSPRAPQPWLSSVGHLAAGPRDWPHCGHYSGRFGTL